MSNKPATDIGDFDFGFTTHTTEELQAPAVAAVATTIDNLLKAIEPLLGNLEKDADKNDTIYWPNRKQKIAEFRQKLNKIAGK